jgi:hypothetical protein
MLSKGMTLASSMYLRGNVSSLPSLSKQLARNSSVVFAFAFAAQLISTPVECSGVDQGAYVFQQCDVDAQVPPACY